MQYIYFFFFPFFASFYIQLSFYAKPLFGTLKIIFQNILLVPFVTPLNIWQSQSISSPKNWRTPKRMRRPLRRCSARRFKARLRLPGLKGTRSSRLAVDTRWARRNPSYLSPSNTSRKTTLTSTLAMWAQPRARPSWLFRVRLSVWCSRNKTEFHDPAIHTIFIQRVLLGFYACPESTRRLICVRPFISYKMWNFHFYECLLKILLINVEKITFQVGYYHALRMKFPNKRMILNSPPSLHLSQSLKSKY